MVSLVLGALRQPGRKRVIYAEISLPEGGEGKILI